MLRSASIKADRGPGSSGMVNTCERSLNVVTQNEPKMLTGSSQTAPWRAEAVWTALSWTPNATGE